MASIYTRRLAGQALDPGVNTVLFTAPAGQVVVVRNVIIANLTQTPGSLLLLIHKPVGGDIWLWNADLLVDDSSVLDIRQELLVGEELRAIAFSAAATILVTGYVFLD